jgi:DNA-binding MarR family transcriptional regulator
MNFLADQIASPPTQEQALRLRRIIGEIVQCCQERTIFESQLFDLPQAELKCLLLFKGERYLTAKQIAREMEVGKSRVTKGVEGLMERGFLERIDDPRDGRVKLLSPTQAGKERMNRVDAFLTKVHARVLSQVDPSQRAAILAALEILWNSMETVKDELKIGN